MVIDTKEQQAFLMQMFEQIQFPGAVLELACEVKKAVREATITSASEEPR